MKKFLQQIIMLSKYLFYGTIIQCFCASMLAAMDVNAQYKSVREVYVDINMKDASLSAIFEEIENKTNYYFAYNSRLTEKDLKVNVNSKRKSLAQVLMQLSAKAKLQFKQVNNNIYVTPIESKKSKPLEVVIKETQINGKVTDTEGRALPGVNVLVKGTTRGTITNIDGIYTIIVNGEEDVLTFSFIGYQTREIRVGNQTQIDVELSEDVSQLNEVIITGYNEVEKTELTSSVAAIKKEEIKNISQPTIDQLLQGRIPGMSVVSSSGEPGAVPVVKIRGTATLTGSTQPLWVVDGVILENPAPISPAEFNSPDLVNRIGNAISGINPEDIESITVLKDASATAIYGVKAAGGVVVLTTKRGEEGKPRINLISTVGVTFRPTYDRFNLMDSKERIDIESYYYGLGTTYYNADANINSVGLAGAYARYKSRDLETWGDFENEVRKAQTYNTDWFDILFRNAVTSNNNINVSGGSSTSQYYASFSYLDQQGADILTDYNRYTALAKLNTQLSESLNAEFYLSGYASERTSYPYSLVPGGVSNFTRGTPRPFDYAINTSRTFPLRNEDGSYNMYRGHEDFYLFNIMNEYDNSDQTTTQNSLTTRVSLDWSVLDNLKLFGILNYSKTNSLRETYYKENTNQVAGIRQSEFGVPAPDYSYLPSGGVIFSTSDFQDYFMGRFAVEYKPISTQMHQVQLYAGLEYRANSYRGDQTTGWGYLHDRGRTVAPTDIIGEAFSGAPYLVISDYERKYASYYGVASYTLNEKYTINGNIRYDGSNLFGSNPKYRWKPAWSVSGRWNLINEPFIQNTTWINGMALRGSYGVQGSTNEQSTPQIVATFRVPGYWSELNQLSIDQPANPNLRWEKTYTTNIGLDFNFLNNTINAAVDVYNRKSEDLIINTRISEVNGFSYLPINFADVTNKGIEVGFTVNPIHTDAFGWSTTINMAYNKNEVTRVNLEPNVSRMLSPFPYKPDAALEGKPLNSLYSTDFAYLDESGVAHFYLEEGDTTVATTGLEFEVGDLVYNGPIEAPYTGGISNFFSYKNFELSVLFTYGFGNYLRMQEIMESWMYAPDQNLSEELTNAWKEEGDEEFTDIPNIKQLTGSNTHKDYWNQSDIRVVKGDYLRLKNVTLRYNLPNALLSKLSLTNAHVQLEGNNLLLFADDRLNGFDPETFVYQSLPNLPSVLLGVNVTF